MSYKSIPCHICPLSASDFTSDEEEPDMISTTAGCCVAFMLQQWIAQETRVVVTTNSMQSLIFYGGVMACDTKFLIRIDENLTAFHTDQRNSDVLRVLCNPKVNGFQLAPVWANLIQQWSEESMRDLCLDMRSIVESCPHIVLDDLTPAVTYLGSEHHTFFDRKLMDVLYRLRLMSIICRGSMWHTEIELCLNLSYNLSDNPSYDKIVKQMESTVATLLKHTPVHWILEMSDEMQVDLAEKIQEASVNAVLNITRTLPNESVTKMLLVATLSYVTPPSKHCSEMIDRAMHDMSISVEDLVEISKEIGDIIDEQTLLHGIPQKEPRTFRKPVPFSTLVDMANAQAGPVAIGLKNVHGHSMVVVRRPNGSWNAYLPYYLPNGCENQADSRIYKMGGMEDIHTILPMSFVRSACISWIFTPQHELMCRFGGTVDRVLLECQMNLLTKAKLLMDVNFLSGDDRPSAS